MNAAALCSQLFNDIDGYSLSASGKDKLNLHTSAFTYGEVSPEAMEMVLDHLSEKDRGVFYDLGSGTGKAVFLSAAIGHFDKSVGVELLPDLHESALHTLEKFDQEIRPHLEQDRRTCALEFRQADIFETAYDDASVIFCHCCTCFEEPLMDKLEGHLTNTPSGCTIITVSRQLKTPAFTHQDYFTCPMGWGNATVYVYRKN